MDFRGQLDWALILHKGESKTQKNEGHDSVRTGFPTKLFPQDIMYYYDDYKYRLYVSGGACAQHIQGHRFTSQYQEKRE